MMEFYYIIYTPIVLVIFLYFSLDDLLKDLIVILTIFVPGPSTTIIARIKILLTFWRKYKIHPLEWDDNLGLKQAVFNTILLREILLALNAPVLNKRKAYKIQIYIGPLLELTGVPAYWSVHLLKAMQWHPALWAVISYLPHHLGRLNFFHAAVSTSSCNHLTLVLPLSAKILGAVLLLCKY